MRDSIREAIIDYFENGTTPHAPAICRDSRRWYYGSAHHGEAILDLSLVYFSASWPGSIDEFRADPEAWIDGIAEMVGS